MRAKKGAITRFWDWAFSKELSCNEYMKSEIMLDELTDKELSNIATELKKLLQQIDFFPAPTEDEIMMHLSKKINLFALDKFIYRKDEERFGDYNERFRQFFEAHRFLFTIENRQHIVGLLRELLRLKGVNTTYREFCRYVKGEISFDEIRDYWDILEDAPDEEKENVMRERDSMFGPYDEYVLDEDKLKLQKFVEHLKQNGFKKTESGDYTNGMITFEHPLSQYLTSTTEFY